MAAVEVALNVYNEELTNNNYKVERVNVTAIATADFYTCRNIQTIYGAMICPAYTPAVAGDTCSVTWAANVATLSFATFAGLDFELVIWGE